MKTQSKIAILALCITGVMMNGCSEKELKPRFSASFYKDGRFESKMDEEKLGFTDTLSIMWELFVKDNEGTTPKTGTVPVHKLTREALLQMPEDTVIRLVHSTLLFRLDGRFVLTDPVFSERISPISFLGPKRFHELPISLDEMPYIDIVIISHNHYDHLDEATIKGLKDRIGHIYTTLGIKSQLVDWGVDASKITELDWWESVEDHGLTITAVSAQHFSARGFFDRNKTLWTSWVIKSAHTNLYFGADSGYFDGFREIGDRYGPFDMTFLEAGAYNERWRSIHMMPEETVQAHLDLKGARLFPIHNGSFKLAMHPWKEPLERVSAEAERKKVELSHPKMGEAVPLLEYKATEMWWE